MKVAFVVNGDESSAMAIRADGLARHLGSGFEPVTFYRGAAKVRAIGMLSYALHRARPDVTYVLDAGYSGVLASTLYRMLGGPPIVLDIGDAITELARSMGTRGPISIAATNALERLSLGSARVVIVRGSAHRDWLLARGYRRVAFLPDGVDCRQFATSGAEDVREAHGLGDALVIGLIGTLTWNRKHEYAYGWELIETLSLLRDLPVRGVLVGDGDALPRLRALAAERGVSDRVAFIGRIAYAELPKYLSAMDVCLSTQSNDLAGRVRTTGKLPLYLAAGRYVLASDVGEASRVLPPEMRLPYMGVKDPAWPGRLAAAVCELLEDRTRLARGEACRAIARERFDYATLGLRCAAVLHAAFRNQALEGE